MIKIVRRARLGLASKSKLRKDIAKNDCNCKLTFCMPRKILVNWKKKIFCRLELDTTHFLEKYLIKCDVVHYCRFLLVFILSFYLSQSEKQKDIWNIQ